MKAFRVTGKFQMGREWTKFSTEVAAESVDRARDRVYSTIGSRHRVNRRQIEIGDVAEVPAEQVTDPAVAQAVQRGA